MNHFHDVPGPDGPEFACEAVPIPRGRADDARWPAQGTREP